MCKNMMGKDMGKDMMGKDRNTMRYSRVRDQCGLTWAGEAL